MHDLEIINLRFLIENELMEHVNCNVFKQLVQKATMHVGNYNGYHKQKQYRHGMVVCQ